MSKFSLDVLQKCVFPFVKNTDTEVILGSAFGEDVALTRIGGDILASHVDPIVGAIEYLGWLAVHVACNDIAASGIPPRWILVLVLVPNQQDEELLKQIMKDISRATKEINVSIIGGHTGYSSGISRPLVAVTALGTASGRNPVKTGGASVGDFVLVTRGIALEGTSILAQDFADIAREKGINEQELAQGKELMNAVSVVSEAMALSEHGATAMHDVTRGGLLETLIEIAYLSKVCIEIDMAKIPVTQIVARFARAFQFDPLRMISSGTIAATVSPDHLKDAENALIDLGIPFANIGRVTQGSGVGIRHEEETIYYKDILCEQDELARMWELYPRKG
ncbi:AIR synthase family protein [bacterium]|nr:AIR synthase family protein [candidate division CSSED10-310 bacterium]